jgi:putative oxidoreductase
MANRLLRTHSDWGALVARLALGIVMLPHGAQVALGWYGGQGFSAMMHVYTDSMHVPAILGLIAIAAIALGPLGLIVGLLGRIAAFGIACYMAVAVLMVHIPNGFFMNWFGNQKGEGYEFHLLAIGLALVVMIKGSGALSLDRLLAKDSDVADLPQRDFVAI